MSIEDFKKNKKIAEYASKYLKNRLELSQKYFLIKNNNNCIELNDFMNNINKINNSISDTDDELKIHSLKKLKDDYLNLYNQKIIIDSEKINELIGIIKYAIENYGIGYTEYASNEAIFIRKMFQLMETQAIDSKNKSVLNDNFYFWKTFFDLSGDLAIAPELSGRIKINFGGGNFAVFNSNKEMYCCVNENGKNYFKLDKDEIFFAQNLVVGIQNNSIGLFIKKGEGTESVLKPLKNYKGEMRRVDNNQGDIKIIANLNDYLEQAGIINLQADIYRRNELTKTFQTIKEYDSASAEEIAIIKMVSATSADFWKNTIFERNNQISNEKKEKFKNYISGEIITALLNGINSLSINTFLEPSVMLKRAMKEIDEKIIFLPGISMNITTKKVVVTNVKDNNKKVIFDYDDPLNVSVKTGHCK